MKITKLFHAVCWLSASILLAASCSKDVTLSDVTDQGYTVTFTLGTPSGDGIIYSKAPVADEAYEYAVKDLTLYEYASDGSFTRSLRWTADGSDTDDFELIDGSNGQYSFSIDIDPAQLGKKFKYSFVANNAKVEITDNDLMDAVAGIDLSNLGATGVVSTFKNSGIPMTGVARNGESEEIELVSTGVECKVDLKRAVARLDVRYQTPNLKVTKITAKSVPAKSYLFEGKLLTDGNSYVELVSDTDLPDDYLQNDGARAEEHIKNALYLYERTNAQDSHIEITVEYDVLGHSGTVYNGSVTVPFKSGEQYVSTERNHLYTIVLKSQYGPDKPVSDKVSSVFTVEDWNKIDMTDDVDVFIQSKANDALKVSKVFAGNRLAATFATPADGKVQVTFLPEGTETSYGSIIGDKDANAYFTYSYLTETANVTGEGANKIEDQANAGSLYRLPTADEFKLLLPDFDGGYYPEFGDAAKNYDQAGVKESFSDGTNAGTKSVLKQGDENTVYGIRFVESGQCAAYRWQIVDGASTSDTYLSVCIKALKNKGKDAVIDDVAKSEFWTADTFKTFNLPLAGSYETDGTAPVLESTAAFWSSSAKDDKSIYALTADKASGAYLGTAAKEKALPVLLVKAE